MQISKQGYDFLLCRIYFTGDDVYQIFLGLAPILSSLMLDSNRKVTNWIWTRILSEKFKPFDTDLEPRISNLANSRGNLKSDSSFLLHNIFS